MMDSQREGRAADELDALLSDGQTDQPARPLRHLSPEEAALAADLVRLSRTVQPDRAFTAALAERLRAQAQPERPASARLPVWLTATHRWPIWAVATVAITILALVAPTGRHAVRDLLIGAPAAIERPALTPSVASPTPVSALATPATPQPARPTATPVPSPTPAAPPAPQPSPRMRLS